MIEEKLDWLRQFVAYVFSRFSRDGCASIAAELTVTTLLAIVPLLTVIISFLSLFPQMQSMAQDVQTWIFSNIIPETGAAIEQYLSEYIVNTSGLTWIGSLMLVLTALMLMKTIDASFNKIWQVKRKSSQVRVFLVYWAVLTLGPLLLAASLATSSYFYSLPLVSEVVDTTAVVSNRIIPSLMAFFAFTVMFIAVPNRKVAWSHAVVASVITTVLFEIAKWGFGVFVKQFSTYQLIFGALAAVPLFLIWLQVTWMVILFGAELCHGLEVFRPDAEKKASHPFILAAQVLKMLISAQKLRNTIGMDEFREQLSKARTDHLEGVLDKLKKAELIKDIDGNGYTLTGDSEQYQLLDLVNAGFNELPNQEAIDYLVITDSGLAQAFQQAKAAMESSLSFSIDSSTK